MIALAVIFILYAAFVLFCCAGLWKKTLVPCAECCVDTTIPVNVLVSLHNEESNVEHLVECLKSQRYTKLNVVLFNDGSTDATLQLIERHIEYLENFKVISQPQQGKDKTIQNYIKTLPEDSLVLITDADCIQPPTWVETMVSEYRNTGASMLIGPVKMDHSHPMQATEFLSVQGVTIGSANMGHPLMCGGANIAVKTSSWNKVCDSVNTKIANGGDMFTLEAMKRASLKIVAVNNPDAVVKTKGVSSLSAFIRQRARWSGKGGAYKDGEILAAGAITVTMQLALIVALIVSPFCSMAMLLWVAKAMVDTPLIASVAVRYGTPRLIWYIIPLSVIYPFYVIFVILISLIRK